MNADEKFTIIIRNAVVLHGTLGQFAMPRRQVGFWHIAYARERLRDFRLVPEADMAAVFAA